ncbi:VacJ family lipoprotein [Desulfobacula sp.]|uniref:MlaA family lipoprotein n=1 Tax=Desulfobacula sp. TaxID=2593537 RepID=UPI00260FA66B|nr:VacJ family lipoprotein [Desulfobacula sp.]
MLKKLLKSFGKIVMMVAVVFIFTSCASAPKKIDPQLPVTPAKHQLSDMNPDIEYAIADAYDPWEGFNRSMYNFNYGFDKYVFLPVVSGYEFIMPNFLEDCVSNFFKNVGEFKNLTNSILQFKGGASVKTLGRFIVNTTIGIGGLFDPATKMGLPRQNEDFGQTLGVYGLGAGPYLVLPIFGPSSLRDTIGLIGDSAARAAVYDWIDPMENVDDEDSILLGISALEAIDARHLQSFRYYEAGSPFEYELIRFLYLSKRKLDVGNVFGKPAD